MLFYPSIAGVDTREAGESNDDNGMLCEMQEAKRVVSLPGSKNSRRAGNFFKIPAILGPTRNPRVELFSVYAEKMHSKRAAVFDIFTKNLRETYPLLPQQGVG